MLSIGIDLGTTNSVASVIRGEKSEVLLNREGYPLTPSVVGWMQGEAEEYLVGQPAVNYAAQAAKHTVFSIKRLMGLNFDDQKVQDLMARVHYEICAAPGAEDIGVRVRLGTNLLTPAEISSMILKKIISDSEEQLGGPIGSGTITVPAFFQDCQRNATREAGHSAGLKLRPLLDEPVAAGLAFGFGRSREEKHRLLVYDLGGGTFDVSLVQMAADNIQVLNSRGDMWLGGDDFDQTIVERIDAWLEREYGADPLFATPEVRRKKQLLARRAKEDLTTKTATQILDPFLTLDSSNRAVSIRMELQRDEFEKDIAPFVERTMNLVDELLEEEGQADHHLSHVLLAGGSTRVPLVRRRLKARFGEEKTRHDLDPMHCVSLGAALWNERFPVEEASGRISLGQLGRTGITIPMDLGIEIYLDGDPHCFDPIIPRKTTYPTEPNQFRQMYLPTSNNQRELRIPVFQGNSPITTFNACQGIIKHTLSKGIPSGTPIRMAFQIDADGILKIELSIEGYPEESQTFQLDRNEPVLSEKERDRIANWKENLKNLIEVGEHFLREYNRYLTKEDRENLNEQIQQARECLAADDRTRAEPVGNAISLALSGSGTASDLFLAKRAQDMAEKDLAGEIARARVALERAYEAKDQPKVQRLSDVLKLATNRVFRIHRSGAGGPQSGQVTKGN